LKVCSPERSGMPGQRNPNPAAHVNTSSANICAEMLISTNVLSQDSRMKQTSTGPAHAPFAMTALDGSLLLIWLVKKSASTASIAHRRSTRLIKGCIGHDIGCLKTEQSPSVLSPYEEMPSSASMLAEIHRDHLPERRMAGFHEINPGAAIRDTYGHEYGASVFDSMTSQNPCLSQLQLTTIEEPSHHRGKGKPKRRYHKDYHDRVGSEPPIGLDQSPFHSFWR
jgi:hypothetical protein